MSQKLLPQVESNSKTIEPGMYFQNPLQLRNETIYPWAPTVIIQKAGASLSSDMSLVDVSSDLLNIVRPLSKDPTLQYLGPESNQPLSHLKDGFFHQESSLLTNPPLFLRERLPLKIRDSESEILNFPFERPPMTPSSTICH